MTLIADGQQRVEVGAKFPFNGGKFKFFGGKRPVLDAVGGHVAAAVRDADAAGGYGSSEGRTARLGAGRNIFDVDDQHSWRIDVRPSAWRKFRVFRGAPRLSV